jgi:excisionase family DNA binding protein
MADEILLTVREAARRLGIGRSLLYQLMLEGQVLSVKIGRSRRIPVWALEEFAKKKAAEASEHMDFRRQVLTLET